MLMNPKITDTNPHVYFLKVFRQYIDNIGYSVMTQLSIDSGLSVGFISTVYHGKKRAGFDSRAAFALAMDFGSHEEMIAYGKTIDQTTHQVVPKGIGNKSTEKEGRKVNQKILEMLLEERAGRAVAEERIKQLEAQLKSFLPKKAPASDESA